MRQSWRKDSIEDMLNWYVEDPHRDDCLTFIATYATLFDTSWGSAIKHQAWRGGYRDHIAEVMRIAVATYLALEDIRLLSFTLSDALVGCFLHDIEKVWVHSDETRKHGREFAIPHGSKDGLLSAEFHLTGDLRNAIKYAHGEGQDYHPTERIQTPLAAFVHHCDNTSARIWFDEPRKSNG